MTEVLAGWSESRFAHDGIEHPVFRRGSGPGVVVIHEIPGITPTVAAFANRVVDAGFTVLLPSLFGEIGRPMSTGYALGQIARSCVSREFHVLASRGSSPVIDWLRALARELHGELGGRGVGALGMCITGNFALAMAVDDALMAPVLSQPSLPFPISAAHRRGLHIRDADLAIVQGRCQRDGLQVLGLRFTGDPTVPAARFDALQHALGDAFLRVDIDSSRSNPHGIPREAHSVLTEHLVDQPGHPTHEALQQVLAFFAEHLR